LALPNLRKEEGFQKEIKAYYIRQDTWYFQNIIYLTYGLEIINIAGPPSFKPLHDHWYLLMIDLSLCHC